MDVAVSLDLFGLAGLLVGGECAPLDKVAMYFEFAAVYRGGLHGHDVCILSMMGLVEIGPMTSTMNNHA
jgi:hypothetical protein